jgi:predicted RNA-binding Zn-ribbon protein involved in translation (DUF1610 family)
MWFDPLWGISMRDKQTEYRMMNELMRKEMIEMVKECTICKKPLYEFFSVFLKCPECGRTWINKDEPMSINEKERSDET